MKKKYQKYIILVIFILGLIVLGMNYGSLFGSTTDWLNQHTVFPDYFRNLFYTTHQLIPNFAFSLGAGQNIFNFSYYGLLNPVILLSYFFPFISMATYIQVVNIILLVSSGLLFYFWMKQKQVSSFSCWITTLLFISATPLIYQAHRHFMFVDYMPFLLLGLIAIDRYFKDGSKSLVSFSIFLMIMTSYYYSIGGLLVLAIYYIYKYLGYTKFSFKQFIKDGIKFLIPYITGILMAGVLLLPTAYVILHGRGDSHSTVSFLDILLPNLDFKTLLYDGYGLGITFISILGLIFAIFSHKKEQKFLAIICSSFCVIPIFMYLLNGGLYIRSKVLIPFLPLIMLLTGYFINDYSLKEDKKSLMKWLPLILGLFSVIYYKHEWYYNLLLFLDIGLTFFILKCYTKTKKNYLLYGIVIISCFVNVLSNRGENYVSIKKYKDINKSEVIDDIKQINKLDKTLYRMKSSKYDISSLNKIYTNNYHTTTLYSSTQNMNYYEFYRNYLGNEISNRNNLVISNTPNFLFDIFMGVKYTVGSGTSSQLGYQKVSDTKDIYQNMLALPIMYATDNIVLEKSFDKLEYPYKSDVLLKNVVIEDAGEYASSDILPVNLDYSIKNLDTNEVIKKQDRYKFSLEKDQKYLVSIDKDLTNQIVLLQFDINNKTSCEYSDRYIKINEKENKVTCDDWLYANDNYKFHYVIAEKKSNEELSIVIGKGDYDINNIKMFVLDYDVIKNIKDDVDPFIFDKDKTKGDNIEGHILVKEDGYFVTTIPYDNGFEIKVDGKNVSYEKVNKSFIGFPITKGQHDIFIQYHAPWLKEGKIVSIIGFGSFGFLLVMDFLNRKKKKSL